jgi:drug/metabolite transporter (DMT)-like permease
MHEKSKALAALFLTVIFFSILVIIAKFFSYSAPSMQMFFLRMFFASFAFFPIFIREKVWQQPGFDRLLFASIFSTINVALFMWGIEYTTATTSQLIYSLIPVLTIAVAYFLRKKKYALSTVMGVFIGLTGVFFILFKSANMGNENVFGSLKGNIAVFSAMLSWFTYILLSKELSSHFKPLIIAGTSIIVAFCFSLPAFLIQNYFESTKIIFTREMLIAGFYMGFIGTFVNYILLQYAIKNLSALTVNLTTYLQPLVVGILALIFLGDSFTSEFIIGGILVFTGVYLTATMDFYRKKICLIQ